MKPKFSSQIEKDLDIIDQWINQDGLGIQYIYNGNEYEIRCDQIEAGELLTKYNVVFQSKGCEVFVENEDYDPIWVEWEDFATANRLTESEAKIIAVGEESEKSMMEWVGEIKSIPTIIKSMFETKKPAL